MPSKSVSNYTFCLPTDKLLRHQSAVYLVLYIGFIADQLHLDLVDLNVVPQEAEAQSRWRVRAQCLKSLFGQNTKEYAIDCPRNYARNCFGDYTRACNGDKDV
jgi:hypothetical protein